MPPRRRAEAAEAPKADLLVTQVKSGIGTKPKHRATLRALGLRGIGQHNTLPDRPEIRGMILRVPHLITVEPVVDGSSSHVPAHRRGSAANDSQGES
jgi:large subunit ribosomal protein L30